MGGQGGMSVFWVTALHCAYTVSKLELLLLMFTRKFENYVAKILFAGSCFFFLVMLGNFDRKTILTVIVGTSWVWMILEAT